jgi:hypothetical protein
LPGPRPHACYAGSVQAALSSAARLGVVMHALAVAPAAAAPAASSKKEAAPKVLSETRYALSLRAARIGAHLCALHGSRRAAEVMLHAVPDRPQLIRLHGMLHEVLYVPVAYTAVIAPIGPWTVQYAVPLM